jgi:UDP-N-acetylglucosamine--N-acetylmuramyl-(pentapeptide) pyrophosphoryl-undecaprenol N-acetylglucosamine transferase
MEAVSETETRCRAPLIHLACSRGGHLDLLLRHRAAFQGCRVMWVTQRSARAARLREQGDRVYVLGEWDRGSLWRTTMRTMRRSIGVLLRSRPRVVVTSGSGIVVPFCVMARVFGARVVFVETDACVVRATSSGRVLSRIAQDVIALWPEMQAVYPHATIARTTVVEGLRREPETVGEGTYVAVGTHSQPFNRLLRIVELAVEKGILPEPLTAQVGRSQQPMPHARVRDIITPEEFEAGINAARYVVCHAGTGTISTVLRAGRRPLVLPRLARYGEHFDDHQRQIVDKLADLDLVVPLEVEITEKDVTRALRPLSLPRETEQLPLLSDCLRGRVQHAVNRR